LDEQYESSKGRTERKDGKEGRKEGRKEGKLINQIGR
jgi:hypothetical protein